jgi:hypothetical protein
VTGAEPAGTGGAKKAAVTGAAPSGAVAQQPFPGGSYRQSTI